MLPRDTKLISSGGDFESWNFPIMGQDLPDKWLNSLQSPKTVIQSVNLLATRRNMFVNDNIVIYINDKKTMRKNDYGKIAVGRLFRFLFPYLFSLNRTEISSKPISYFDFFV